MTEWGQAGAAAPTPSLGAKGLLAWSAEAVVGWRASPRIEFEGVLQGEAGALEQPQPAFDDHRAGAVTSASSRGILLRARASPWPLDRRGTPGFSIAFGVLSVVEDFADPSSPDYRLVGSVRSDRTCGALGVGLTCGRVRAFDVTAGGEVVGIFAASRVRGHIMRVQLGVRAPVGGNVRDEAPSPDVAKSREAIRMLEHTALLTPAVVAMKAGLDPSAARKMFVRPYAHFEDNVATPPRFHDGNPWTTNWVTHPVLGAQGYLVYRALGHGKLASMLGATLLSTVHEYVIETSFEPPSGIDLVVTPGLGIPLGMVLEPLGARARKNPRRWVRVLAVVVDPAAAMGSASR